MNTGDQEEHGITYITKRKGKIKEILEREF
jgi:hypothetical protein